MAKYETLYIIQPSLPEDQVEEVVRSFETVIPEHRGSLIRTDKWGKRKLAYRIGRHWEGYYVLHEYDGDGSTQRELERRLKIHDDVIRHLTTRVDPRMAAELARRAEREKRGEGRREEAGEPWSDRRDMDSDRREHGRRGRGREAEERT